MHRLFDYLSDTGAMPLLGAIEAPPAEFSSLAELFDKTYKHENILHLRLIN